ncbi:MAG: radical SAM protein [Desulfobacula sp.]|nr:radical SAM protein [Desulfobacula sp.]
MKFNVKALETVSRDFFGAYGTPKLLGRRFFSDIGTQRKEDVFNALVKRCGYENNETGFFHDLVSCMEKGPGRVVINKIGIPKLYLYALLSHLFPGNRLHTVKTVDELGRLAFVREEDRACLQKVMDEFPVRLSDHVIRQSRVSGAVAKQYLPFAGELDLSGKPITFDGHFKSGVLEQMYQNRVIFLLDMTCPVYCRFCFRKHKSNRKEKTPSGADVLAAVNHVQGHPSIREILITGGEPLLNRPNLEAALNSLMTIGHVDVIRIATRSVAYYPELFLKDTGGLIQYLIDKNDQCRSHGKRIEMGLHFVHPDEVSVQSLEIISAWVQKGIQVYVQTPFLNGLNTDGKTLGRLFTQLRQAGVKIYYIFTPCSPIHGTKDFWSPISKALEAQAWLRDHVSDRNIPKLCTATPLGKIEWHTSGFAVEKDAEDETFTWIRTPYTLSYFKDFIPDINTLPDMRINPEGTLDARFQVTMGDDALFLGNRPEKIGIFPESGLSSETLEAIRAFIEAGSGLSPSLCPTSSKFVSRVHKTRVEMDVQADDPAFGYIEQDPEITDVVVPWQAAQDPCMEKIGRMAERLKAFSHILSLRICCREFSERPEVLTDDLMEKISRWCDFSIGNPFRVEVEVWFLLPEDLGPGHGEIAKKLIHKGVNIYANVPLIQGVNDSPETVVALAHGFRRAAIEFHHLYVSGLDIQEKFNEPPIDSQRIIDIASAVRKECSGREIPLYIRRTPSGEKDFGISDLWGS